MNKKEELKRLIDNPLKPNAVEWAMDSEDVLSNMNLLSPETKHCIKMIKDHGGAFKQYNDALVAILKRAYKSIANVITPPPIKSRHADNLHCMVTLLTKYGAVHIEVFVSFREKMKIQQIPRLMNC